MTAWQPNDADRAAEPRPADESVPSVGSGSKPPLDATVDQSATDRGRAQQLSRDLDPPASLPGYEMLRCLGAGAFGTVWQAKQESTGKMVAVKFYQHRGGLDWGLLNREVEKLAFLYTDRDIVQLIDVGWDSTPPYYVMEYLERGSLEGVLRKGPVPVREVVRIVTEVAQALVHAHGRGILHCDLKPANVLLDNDWKVRLADFGQSRLSTEQLPALGTLFYMAPEQADLKATPDARWDVYALGALLYHLLTGSPPHRSPQLEHRFNQVDRLADRLAEYRQAIRDRGRPTAVRRVRGVDRALAEIVERCLEPDPARRFPNAQAVLEALNRRERYRARRPLFALGLVAPLLLLVATVTLGVIGWRDAVRQSEQTLVRAVQAGNVYAAGGVASTVLLRLRDLSSAVHQTSRDLDLRRLLDENDTPALQQFIERTHRKYNDPASGLARDQDDPPFESWVVMDDQGFILVRSPFDRNVISGPERSPGARGDYSWRDYFQGPVRYADQPDVPPVYVSRVFRSEADRLYKFSLSSLVRDSDAPDARILGVVVATITTGSLPLEDDRRTAVLVGRWDKNRRPGAPEPADPPPENLILLHPVYDRGDDAVEIDNKMLLVVQQHSRNQLGFPGAGRRFDPEQAMDDNYGDPVAREYPEHPEYHGRWLAGFAPVGSPSLPTELVVIVQQRYDKAVDPLQVLARTLAWRGWIALTVGVVLMAVMWYWVQRAIHREDSGGFWERTLIASGDPGQVGSK